MTCWHDFVGALEEPRDGYRTPPTYLYRGQADSSWPLEPSLLRCLRNVEGRASALDIERLLEEEFKAQAALFPETKSVLLPFFSGVGRTTVWAYMQHHSCATRLLDWTASPFVAVYFAVNEQPEEDGALFVVAPAALQEYSGKRDFTDDDLVDPDAPERVTFTWPTLRSVRAATQQGHFSVSTNILGLHDDPILEACASIETQKPGTVVYRKIVIARDLKVTVLQQLRAMNVAPHTLFPSLDGLGRSLSDLARLEAVLRRRPAGQATPPPSEPHS